ncbi:hypothetical protein BRADI_3g28583v3 [Brachypodium distachyon]|uniref:Uncharacterized protein n=1 Tax=Brachypodium distachyon TaxID=15368 RepID=A0A2K2CZR9_BRADI|nr:hypothetical protein BRADI_3g28583v3 [Brachypodium distachyon]
MQSVRWKKSSGPEGAPAPSSGGSLACTHRISSSSENLRAQTRASGGHTQAKSLNHHEGVVVAHGIFPAIA